MRLFKLLILFSVLSINVLSQDSIIYYSGDTVIGRVLEYESSVEHYDWKDSLLFEIDIQGNEWIYYKADTICQKIVFSPDGGHQYFSHDNGIWIEGIKCIKYSTTTSYAVKLTKPVNVYSKNRVAYISSDDILKSVKVYSINGKLLKELCPFSKNVHISFNASGLVILEIDGTSHKLSIN